MNAEVSEGASKALGNERKNKEMRGGGGRTEGRTRGRRGPDADEEEEEGRKEVLRQRR